MKVGIIQKEYVADAAANRKANAIEIEKAARNGADIVVLSELHDSLYFCQTENVDYCSQAVSISVDSEPIRFYSGIAVTLGVVLVCSMFERRAPGLYHNTAVVFEKDGSMVGIYRKMHIPDDPAYYEKYYFTPGDLGFNPIRTSVGSLGVLVCWDQWYPEAARIMALGGADILIYPTAIGWESTDTPAEQGRQLEAWTTIQRAHAVANGLPVISVNRCGFEVDPSGQTNGIRFWGHSFVAGPQGEVLFRADEKPVTTVVEVDMERTENVRRWWPFLRDRRIDAYSPILKRFLLPKNKFDI